MIEEVERKNITITIVGECGSGKTGTAVAIAKMLNSKGARVVVDDQDGDYAAMLAMGDDRIDAVAPQLNVTIKTVSAMRHCTLSELEK